MGQGGRDRLPRRLLCLVTDRRRLAPAARTQGVEVVALERLIDDAMAEGVGAVQIREPDLPARVLAALVSRVVARRAAGRTLVLVNDRADVAWVAEADGVHLRAISPAADRIRLLGPGWILGRSVHADDSRGWDEDLDYVMFGTVFPSVSKPEGHRAAGLDALRHAVERARRGVVAIGGIQSAAHAAACIRAGASGVAAIAIFLPEGAAAGAIGTRRAVRELSAAIGAAG